MPWSDIPTVLKNMMNYFGPDQHERRVLRKFVGRWDLLRPYIVVDQKRAKSHLEKMDKLRKELK